MTPDYRALISQMAAELDHCQQLLRDDRRQRHPLADRARTLLAEADGPAVPDGREPASVTTQPSDAELEEEFGAALLKLPGDSMNTTAVAFARAVLARWGRPAAAPVAMIELITDMSMHLAHMQEMLEDYEYFGPEDRRWHRESARLRSLAAEVLA